MHVGFEFSGPYRSAEEAEDKIRSFYAEGLISESDCPRVAARRRARKNAARWFVILNG